MESPPNLGMSNGPFLYVEFHWNKLLIRSKVYRSEEYGCRAMSNWLSRGPEHSVRNAGGAMFGLSKGNLSNRSPSAPDPPSTTQKHSL